MSLPNTRKSAVEIGALLSPGAALWFIGIGGIHMSSLALLAAARGFAVAGSDCTAGENVARLRAAGISVFIGHDGARAAGSDAVIYTLAISADNPEYRVAQALGIPSFSRADFLGYLMAPYPRRIGVAGSHGKSTVTAMLGEIFVGAHRAPTVVCGAVLRRFCSPLLMGTGDSFIFEACEYEDSFLSLSPTIAILLNASLDHVDYFPSIRAVVESFGRFASLPGTGGNVLVNADDPALMAVTADCLGRRTFGFSPAADYRAAEVEFRGGLGRFRLQTPGGDGGEVALSVPGRHNIYNALAAAGAAELCGISSREICRLLGDFRGAARRLEYKGILCGAAVYDDYAHHPEEIAATLKTARTMVGNGRLLVVFQSHTYSRTAAFLAEIAAALRLADRIFVTDIYAAREQDSLGVSGALLAETVGEGASYKGSFDEIADALSAELAPGDLLVVMGAGDVDRIFGEFSRKGFTS